MWTDVPQFEIILAKMLIIVSSWLFTECLLYVGHILYIFSHLTLVTTFLVKYDLKVDERNGLQIYCHLPIHVLLNILHQYSVCSVYQELSFAFKIKR